jgi:hypothetical protein
MRKGFVTKRKAGMKKDRGVSIRKYHLPKTELKIIRRKALARCFKSLRRDQSVE